MSTYTNNLELVKHASGDEEWGDDMNNNLDKIDAALKNFERIILLHGYGGVSTVTNGDSGIVQLELNSYGVELIGSQFDSDTVAKYHYWSLVLPPDYDGGELTAQVYWTTNDASPSGDISWKIDGRAYTDGDSLDNSWGAAVEIVDSIIGQNILHISDISDGITLAGNRSSGKHAQIQICRDGSDESDTSSNSVVLLYVLLKYTAI
jgi:hypothetical protein